jgi:hypothetical protein
MIKTASMMPADLQQLCSLPQRCPRDVCLPVWLRPGGRCQLRQALPGPAVLHRLGPEADAQHAPCSQGAASRQLRWVQRGRMLATYPGGGRQAKYAKAANPPALQPIGAPPARPPPSRHCRQAPSSQALQAGIQLIAGRQLTWAQGPRPVGQHLRRLRHLLQAEAGDHGGQGRQLIQPAGVAHPEDMRAGQAVGKGKTWDSLAWSCQHAYSGCY